MRKARSRRWTAHNRRCPCGPTPRCAETRTHDYVRHGTTTLFAALNVLDVVDPAEVRARGTVIGSCKPRHRHQEFLEFMNEVDRKVPRRRAIHLILDNYGTHTHPKVPNEWFAAHPRYYLHFVPTSASWLNLVESRSKRSSST